jgi:hypothetical protein
MKEPFFFCTPQKKRRRRGGGENELFILKRQEESDLICLNILINNESSIEFLSNSHATPLDEFSL